MKKILFFIICVTLFGCSKDFNDIENYYDSRIKINFYINGFTGMRHGVWVYLSEKDMLDDNWHTQIALFDSSSTISIPKDIDGFWIKCMKMERDFTYEKVQQFKLPSHKDDILPTYRLNLVADVRKTCFQINRIIMQSYSVPSKKIVGGSLYSGYIVDEWDDNLADDLSSSKPDIYVTIEDIYKSSVFGYVDYPYIDALIFEPINVVVDKDSYFKVKLMDYDFNVSSDDFIDSCTVAFPTFPNDYYYPVKKLHYRNFLIEIDWL